MVRRFTKLVSVYFLIIGIAAHVVGAVVLYKYLSSYELTLTQLMTKAGRKAGLDTAMLQDLLAPSPAFDVATPQGKQRSNRPRLFFPELTALNGSERKAFWKKRQDGYAAARLQAFDVCHGGGFLGSAACWFVKRDADKARLALDGIRTFKLKTPNASGQYGNGWQLAMAYDLLFDFPGFTDELKRVAENRLETAIRDYLIVLDGDSASLWHGRATLAAEAMICAAALDADSPVRKKLLARAEAHYLDVMDALALTEAWPEGYNYWINDRAFKLVLASAAYLNAFHVPQHRERLLEVLERVGLWHVYQTRPDNRVEGFGDEGSRVDLKDETRRVIDLIAQLTRNRVLAAYSRYLVALHGRESYYRGYRWWFPLLNDPTLAPESGENPDLDEIARWLPRAAVFGEGAVNQVIIRSGWGDEDTFISFRSGDRFTHHGHFDAGHFSLFKGAPLAITSGTYGLYFSEHRLNYAIRTVSRNSLLIMRPNETVQPNRFFKENVADGGQRVFMATGSAIRNTHHWRENLDAGLHLEGGKLLAFTHLPGRYAYVKSDLTRAYNTDRHDDGGYGGKVQSVVRELLYLYPEDRLYISDTLLTTKPSFRPKWLLHTVSKPNVQDLRALKGSMNNGILESSEKLALISNGRGRLRLDSLLPEDATMRLVGGADYQFYVDIDGDDSTLDGRNMSGGAKSKPWFDVGWWRIEIQPSGERRRNRFLTALSPSLDEFRSDAVHRLDVEGDGVAAVASPASVVLFFERRQPEPVSLRIPAGAKSLYAVGLPPFRDITISLDGRDEQLRSSGEGTIWLEISGQRSMSLSW